MDTTAEMMTNDVPAYLNDLIPYRCPKCGHQRRFATLRELRVHLQNDHAFQVGCIKPNSRATNVFSKNGNGKNDNHNSPRGIDKMADVAGSYANDYQEMSRFVGERESSPLLRTFKDETNALEMELQQAKQDEMRNKAMGMKQLANTSSYGAEYRREPAMAEGLGRGNLHKVNVTVPAVSPRLSKSQLTTPDVKSTLDKLNAEVMRSRLNQWVTSDALYKSQEILSSMEEAADANVREQQGIVQQLIKDIRNKGQRIEERERDERELLNERQRLYTETENLVKEADNYNQDLRQELDRRSQALETLTTDMKRLQSSSFSISEKELKTKDNDLQFAEEKMRRLEWERDKLIDETENILKRADADNAQLRNTIKTKEEELNSVNQELFKLRQNHHAMLEETADIQTRAAKSQTLMKTVLDAKNAQLESATRQLEEMKNLQAQLVEESRIITEQADDNTHAMKRLLENKEDHVRELMFELDRLRGEKFRLEESTSSLEEKAEQSTSMIESLKDVVKRKENDLKTTQSELVGLKEFLQTAAAKERGARKKLEKFIDDLIHRAEKAESDLRTLRSQSTSASSENKPSASSPPAGNVHAERKPTDHMHDDRVANKEGVVLPSGRGQSSAIVSGTGVMGHAGSTERLGLPPRISPPKPPRTKIKLPNLETELHNATQRPQNTRRNDGTVEPGNIQPQNILHTRAEVYRQDETSYQRADHPQFSKTSLPGVSNSMQVQPEHTLPMAGNVYNDHKNQSDGGHEDLNTINTDSLVEYLNEGIIINTTNKPKLPRDKLNSSSNMHNVPSQFDHHDKRNRVPTSERRQSDTDGLYRKSKWRPSQLHPDTKEINQGLIKEHQKEMLHQLLYRAHYGDGSRRSPAGNDRTDYRSSIRVAEPRSPYVPLDSSQMGAQRYGPHIRRAGHNNNEYPTFYQDRPLYREPNMSNRVSERPSHMLRDDEYSDYDGHHKVTQHQLSSSNHRPVYNTIYGTDKRDGKRTALPREYMTSGYHNHRESGIPDGYTPHDPRDDDERYYKLIERLKRRKMAREANTKSSRRFKTVGKSNGRGQSPPRRYRNDKRSNKTKKLGQFDSTFPEIYSSLHDLHSRSRHKGNEKFESNSRRSRSLSPVVHRGAARDLATRKPNIEREERKRYTDSESHTDAESANSEHTDESNKDGSEGFVELMDENGILWASNEDQLADPLDDANECSENNEDDTLPDISDSELDRVSPSGSEAIATKKTNQVLTAAPQSRVATRDPKRAGPSSRRSTNEASTRSGERSKSISKLTPSRSPGKITPTACRDKNIIKQCEFLEERTNGNGQQTERPRIVRVSKKENDRILQGSAVFQPIKVSGGSKHSLSERDLTSGGKEIHEYVKQSPKLDVRGSPETTTSELFSKRSINPRGRSTETLEEKLLRISEKYKSQRVVIGSSINDPQQTTVASSSSDIDTKVKSINDKYKAKRRAITESKSVVGNAKDTQSYSVCHDSNVKGLNSLKSDLKATTSNPDLGNSLHNKRYTQRSPHSYPSTYNPERPQYVSVPNLGHGSPNFIHHGGQSPIPLLQTHPGLSYPEIVHPRRPYGSFPEGQVGPMHNPYLPNYHSKGDNGQVHQSFPYLFPYFYPNAYPGLQSMATHDQNNGLGPLNRQDENEAFKNLALPLNKETESPSCQGQTNNTDKSNRPENTTFDEETMHNRKQYFEVESTSGIKRVSLTNESNEVSRIPLETGKSNSPIAIRESYVDEERAKAIQQKDSPQPHGGFHVEDKMYKIQDEKTENLDKPLSSVYSKVDNSFQSLTAETHPTEVRECDFQAERREQLRSPAIDRASVSEETGMSMFAAPIDDDSSVAACDSATQSAIDLQGSGIDTDMDTDTESVKRDFFDKAKRIRGMLAEPHVDEEDSISKRSFNRNEMSSASSQG